MSLPGDAEILANNPIGEGLASFRSQLQAKCNDHGVLNVKDLNGMPETGKAKVISGEYGC